VASPRLRTARLDLHPLPAAAARALPDDRAEAGRLLGAELAPEWPLAELLDALPFQAASAPDDEPFGVWLFSSGAPASSSATRASSARPARTARSSSATASCPPAAGAAMRPRRQPR